MTPDPRYEAPQLMIGGRLRGAATAQPVTDPATGQWLAELPLATNQDLDDALAEAEKAFPSWKAIAPVRRGQIIRSAAQLLRDRASSIARSLTLEQGKPLAESLAEIGTAADTLDWFAE